MRSAHSGWIGGDAPRPQPAGLDQLARHDPAWRPLRQHGAGGDREHGTARAAELPRIAVAETEV